MKPPPDSHELDDWQMLRAKTSSKKNRCRRSLGKPGRPRDFVIDTNVIARQQRALVRMHAAQ